MKLTLSKNMALAAAGVLSLMAGLTARADYPSAVLADGPLTYHRFSETGVTNDIVPVVANLGTLGAAANGTHISSFRDDLIAQGLPGALDDPANTAISIPYSPITHSNFVRVPWQAGLAYNGPFSFEIWAKPGTRYYNYPFGMVNWTSPRTGWVFMQSDWDNLVTGNGWVFRLYQNSGTTSTTAYYGLAINTNHWYHLVGVYDGAYARLYVDGVQVSSTACSAYVPAISTPLMIGVSGSSQYQYGGLVDETAFYTNALTASEVASHYACATTNPTYYPTLVLAKNPPGYWRFNEKFAPSVAENSSTRGAAANAQYRTYSTTVPELQGPTFPGFEVNNRALQLFGTNGCVVVPPPNFYANNVTFECMLKRSGNQSDFAGIAMHGNVMAVAASPCVAGLIFRGTGNTLGYWWYSTNTAASDSFSYQSSLVPPDETWVYAAVTITPTSGTIYMYDGTNWSSAVNTKTHKTTSFTGPCWIGGDRNVAARWFKGSIDEVAIYDKALTEAQLRCHALIAFGDTNTPGLVTSSPVMEPSTLFEGLPFKLSIDAYGAPPLTYQWRVGDTTTQTDILDATNASFMKASASVSDNGYYDVIISNAYGAVTSSVAFVYANAQSTPSITADPVSRAVYPGGSVTLGVRADGPGLTYQWQHEGTNVPGATGASFTVAINSASAGEYKVGITNLAGGVLSAGATVSLLSYDSNNTYVSAVLADGPEGYWRLDETAAPIIYDAMGRHDGQTWRSTPAYDPTGGQWGSAWNQTGALADDTDKALAFGGANFALIPYSPDLNVPTYTIELWAKPTTFTSGATHYPLVSEDFWTSPSQVAPPCLPDNYRGGYRFAVTGTAKTWTFGVGGMTTWDVQYNTSPVQALNTWVHLVGTFDGWQESLYMNGVLVGSTIGLGLPNQRLGLQIGGDNAAYGFGNPFYGVVDEAAYYKTVLSAARIKLHYQLGKYGTNNMPVFINGPANQTVEAGSPVSFSTTHVGATPMTYQWKQGSTSLATGTDAALSIASVDYTQAGQYTLAATNSYGGAVSTAATLTVAPPASVTNLNARITYPGGVPKLELIWPLGYSLYYATDVTSTVWLPVAGAVAPYYNVPISPAVEKIFYKIQ